MKFEYIKHRPDSIRYMVRKCKNRFFIKEIINIYNIDVGYNSLLLLMRKYKIPINTNERASLLTCKTLKCMYRNLGMRGACRQLNISRSTFKAIYKENLGEKSYYEAVNRFGKKYRNDVMFESMSKSDFYIAGFLLADGNLKKDSASNITLKLARKDDEILKKISRVSNATNPILYGESIGENNKKYKNASLSFHCKESRAGLENNFGVFPVKTYNAKIKCEIENHENVPHFIRGAFDGDGCISGVGVCEKGHLKDPKITIAGTVLVVNSIKRILDRLVFVGNPRGRVSYRKETKNMHVVEYCGVTDVSKIGEFMYRDAENLYIDRKKELFDSPYLNPEFRRAIALKNAPTPPQPVVAINVDNNNIIKFPSIIEGARKLSIDTRDITKNINGRINNIGEWVFIRAEEFGSDDEFDFIKFKTRFIMRKSYRPIIAKDVAGTQFFMLKSEHVGMHFDNFHGRNVRDVCNGK